SERGTRGATDGGGPAHRARARRGRGRLEAVTRDRRLAAAEQRARRLKVPQRLEERFSPYRDDVVRFATELLGLTLPPYQVEILRAVQETEQVAWVGGHATGKSELGAVLLAWYLLTRVRSRCIVTSATFERQVGRIIFAKL